MRKILPFPFALLMVICAACQVINSPELLGIPTETTTAVIAKTQVSIQTGIPTKALTSTPSVTIMPQISPTPSATTETRAGRILIIIGDRFIADIYKVIHPAFKEAGYYVVVASRTMEPIRAKNVDLNVSADLLLVDVQVADYDAIVFCCDNDITFGTGIPDTNRIAQEAVAEGKIVAAICSGPRVLAYAQVVAGKTVTGEASQTCQLLQQAGGNCTGKRIERDGLMITAKDRFASQVFGEAIIDALQEQSAQSSFGKTIDGLIAFYSDRDGNPEIYTIKADGSGLVRLTNDPAFDDSPAISPDGSQIVFLTARHDPTPRFPNLMYEIYLMNIDGSNSRRLTYTDAAEDHPAWSPDGSKIIFDADYDQDGFFEIYTMNMDGTDLTRLTFNTANDQFADWSPDGMQIAFSSDRNGNWDIFLMEADGSNQQPITNSPDWELFPAWSPSGDQIAFVGLLPHSRNTDIFIMNADGSSVQQLTDTTGFDESPDWSPDGSQIIFQTQRNGDFDLFLMKTDGSDQLPLVISSADELWPSSEVAALPSEPTTRLQLEPSNQELGMAETFQAALGDLDNDGDLDAVFANPMRNNAEVWLNDSTGFFVNTGQQLTQFGHGAGLADLDGDDDLDALIVCHQGILPSKIYLNDGIGFLLDNGQNLDDARFSAADLNLLDLNGDGYMDFHVLYYSSSGVPDKVYLNNGDATFRDSGLTLGEDFIAWGDLDGDSDIDYLGKDWGRGYVVMVNDGSGQFSTGWQMEDNQATVGDVALADFDTDGDLDALIANGFRETGSQPSRLLWNDGRGQFIDSRQVLFKTMGAHFAVGDLDLDGDLDVFVTNMDRPNEVWLYEDGQFFDSGLRLGHDSEMSGRPSLGDLDGDGDLDVVVGRFRGGAVIWFNQNQ